MKGSSRKGRDDILEKAAHLTGGAENAASSLLDARRSETHDI
jgi:hypothetical protein